MTGYSYKPRGLVEVKVVSEYRGPAVVAPIMIPIAALATAWVVSPKGVSLVFCLQFYRVVVLSALFAVSCNRTKTRYSQRVGFAVESLLAGKGKSPHLVRPTELLLWLVAVRSPGCCRRPLIALRARGIEALTDRNIFVPER